MLVIDKQMIVSSFKKKKQKCHSILKEKREKQNKKVHLTKEQMIETVRSKKRQELVEKKKQKLYCNLSANRFFLIYFFSSRKLKKQIGFFPRKVHFLLFLRRWLSFFFFLSAVIWFSETHSWLWQTSYEGRNHLLSHPTHHCYPTSWNVVNQLRQT